MAVALAGFDYSELDKDTKGMLISIAGDIRRSTKGHLEHAIEMGESVTQANELFAKAGCEGKFGVWVKGECGFSKRTAYNYMNAYARFGGNRASLAQFTAEAVYLLSEDSVSDEVVAQAIKLAGKGHRITKDSAAELKRLDEEGDETVASDFVGDVVESQPLAAATEQPTPATPPPPAEPAAIPPPESPDSAGKLFSKLLEHLRQSVLLLDEINHVAPNSTARQEVFDSLECANKDIQKWRKQSKR